MSYPGNHQRRLLWMVRSVSIPHEMYPTMCRRTDNRSPIQPEQLRHRSGRVALGGLGLAKLEGMDVLLLHLFIGSSMHKQMGNANEIQKDDDDARANLTD